MAPEASVRASKLRILAMATQGLGSNDFDRVAHLLDGLDLEWLDLPRGGALAKAAGSVRLWRRLRRRDAELVVLEGTGVAAGIPLILSAMVSGTRYVVSSGDAVGPFIKQFHPGFGIPGHVYERLLYGASAGFVGWSPYLVGRALTLGAPRGMCAPGWPPPLPADFDRARARAETRRAFGIPDTALVIGIAGSLLWNGRRRYCYGVEIARALQIAERPDAYGLIVGDGSGLPHLRAEAARMLGDRIFFCGRVPRAEVARYIAAFDLASLPQSLDGVGSFRYTTKLSEYARIGVPIVTGPLPLAYDLEVEAFFRLTARAPWSSQYALQLAGLIDRVKDSDLSRASDRCRRIVDRFDLTRQQAAVRAFLSDLAGPSC